ncbi:ECF RNA polymerase sigma-E factor [Paraconexibacter sp. AEG42_29]|uniref:ECF RNA polymerase sigma-E factor n=1 Tax=Paraconexibacter sp. AEG42_29 TaxID=2997339 RepID=A0AAU7AYL2_9ACTN
MTTVLLHPAARTTDADAALVARVRNGDDQAFTTLVLRHEQALIAYARTVLGGAHHDAEECVQDAFVRALTFLRRQTDRDIALKPWLYTIVRNACLDRLRSGAARPTVALEALEGVLTDSAGDPHAALGRREQLRVIVGGLQELPARQRAALVMHELEGRPHEELAGSLGVSVGASKALVCRARQGMAHLRPAA